MRYVLVTLVSLAMALQVAIAKEITLDQVQLHQDSPIHLILKEVLNDGDSITHATNNLYVITFNNSKDGYYVSVTLCKTKMLPNVKHYIGYQNLNNNIIVYRGNDVIPEFQRSILSKLKFRLDLSIPKVDGTISWLYYVRKNAFWKLSFNDNW